MGEKLLTFVCWKWDSSKYPHGRKKRRAFNSHHVNVLFAMLSRNISLPFRLICVTDDPVGINPEIEIIPIWDEFRELGGCFLRLVAFKREFELFGPRFISIDLDCVILKDITHLFTREEKFVIWHPRKAVRWLPQGEKGKYYCGSLWMLTAGERSIVYDTFHPENFSLGFDGRYEGGTDQKHISKTLYPNEACWTIDDGVCLFVDDLARPKRGVVAVEDPSIVFFNGRFMPDDYECLKISWVRENYTLSLEKPKPEPIPVAEKERLNIVAFWWGEWPGKDGKGEEYVLNLFEGIKKHLPKGLSYQFVLFTDRTSINGLPENIVVRSLKVPDSLKWNLKKVFMFSKESGLEGPTICFDLDSLILGDLNPLLKLVYNLKNKPGNYIITCEDAYSLGRAGGSIVGFLPSPELEKVLWEPILVDRKSIEISTRGSERFYYRQKSKNGKLHILFWEKLIPGKVFSYKRDCGNGEPKGVSVIRFHGLPRPHQVDRSWVKQIWKAKIEEQRDVAN